MQIDKQLISRLEHLSRLELESEEKEQLLKDLNNILQMVEKLQELSTDEVEPLVYLNEDVNVWRKDRIDNQLDRSAALKNAPDQDGIYFKVPKVIDLK